MKFNIVNLDKMWDTGNEYENMDTRIEGYEDISYEEKKNYAKEEILNFCKECCTIKDVKMLIENNKETFESGRLYLEWSAVWIENENTVGYATRTD